MSEVIDVIIYVSGGIVQSVGSSLAVPAKTIRAIVVDFDNGAADPNAPVVAGDRASVHEIEVDPYNRSVEQVREGLAAETDELGNYLATGRAPQSTSSSGNPSSTSPK